MNVMDIVLCIPLVWGLYKGFTKGFIVELASLVAFGLGIWGAYHFSAYTAEVLKDKLNVHSPYLPIISFSFTSLLIVIAIFLLAKLLQKFAEGMALGTLDKIAGALFSALKYALLLSVCIFVLDTVEKKVPLISVKIKEGSFLYKPIGNFAPFIIPKLKEIQVKS
jgi:membrane protein required for colicin V production